MLFKKINVFLRSGRKKVKFKKSVKRGCNVNREFNQNVVLGLFSSLPLITLKLLVLSTGAENRFIAAPEAKDIKKIHMF